MQVSVTYFAILKDKAGRKEESVVLNGELSAKDLYLQLAEKHGFPLGLSDLRVAIDDEFSTFDQKLRGGEKVVFIPPVAGG